MGSSDRERNHTECTPDLAHGLPYLDSFVRETQRLHNASFQPGRTTKTDVVLPGGCRCRRTVVVPALDAIHTNPSVWRDAFRFDPDRWNTGGQESAPLCVYPVCDGSARHSV